MCLHDKYTKCSRDARIHLQSKDKGIWEKVSRPSYWLWAEFQLLAAELGLWLPRVHTPLPSDGSPQFQSSGSPRQAAWLSPVQGIGSTNTTVVTHRAAITPDCHPHPWATSPWREQTENQTTFQQLLHMNWLMYLPVSDSQHPEQTWLLMVNKAKYLVSSKTKTKTDISLRRRLRPKNWAKREWIFEKFLPCGWNTILYTLYVGT